MGEWGVGTKKKKSKSECYLFEADLHPFTSRGLDTPITGITDLKTLFVFLLWPHPLPHPPTPSHDQPQYSPDNKNHIKDLSYLCDSEVIIRLLSLPRWGPIRVINMFVLYHFIFFILSFFDSFFQNTKVFYFCFVFSCTVKKYNKLE